MIRTRKEKTMVRTRKPVKQLHELTAEELCDFNVLKEEDTQEPEVEVLFTKRQLELMLKDHHKKFCREYVRNGWNRSEAYLKVYPSVRKNSAYVLSTNLLKNVKIRQYINVIKEDFEKLCHISKASQLQEYRKIAYSSFRHLHNSFLQLKEWEEVKRNNPEVLDSVESISVSIQDTKHGQNQYVKIKLYSKLAAMERIDKLMGYQTPEKFNVEQETTVKLGTGNVMAIREAFGLQDMSNPIN